MEKLLLYALIAVAGYLIGSVSPARIIFASKRPGEQPVKIRTPTTDGKAELVAHAVGATNVMIAFGPRWGMLVTFLDAAKAFIPTLTLMLLFPGNSYHLVCAVAVLIGHLWPVWFGFCGGGGNSSIMGMLLAISPLGLLVTHAGGMLIGQFLPVLAFVGGVILMIPWFIWRNGLLSPETAFSLLVAVIYFLGQLPEAMAIRQLKRDGHTLEMRHVMRLMKKSAKTGQAPESGGKDSAQAEGDKDSGRR